MNSPKDVIVIGAGPAGLAAAKSCMDLGLTVEVVEQGKDVAARSQQDPADAITGVGGAGLYSDGKFSFFPSASRLWQLQPRDDLLRSYSWVSALLRQGGLEAEPIPVAEPVIPVLQSASFVRKYYPSYYMPLFQRLALIENLAREVPVLPLTKLVAAALDEHTGSIVLSLSGPTGAYESLCRAVVFAGGRFGPFLLPHLFFGKATVFRRIEIGVRIEQNADSFFLQSEEGIDPKFIAVDQDIPCEWRTFCCCRDGLIVASTLDGLLSLSGRADCPPSGRSNVGFNVRLTNEDIARSLWPEALRRISTLTKPLVEPLAEVMLEKDVHAESSIKWVFGPAAPLLVMGLKLLVERFPGLLIETLLHAPTIEGVGHYPQIDTNLRAQPYPVWVAGDASGIFRGLTAALVSGYHAGIQVAEYLR